MKVNIGIAQRVLELTDAERVALAWRRRLNAKLAEIRRQRLALVEGVVALNEEAPGGDGGGQETRGVSTRINIPPFSPGRKGKVAKKKGGES